MRLVIASVGWSGRQVGAAQLGRARGMLLVVLGVPGARRDACRARAARLQDVSARPPP